jgi:hypothetical protein
MSKHRKRNSANNSHPTTAPRGAALPASPPVRRPTLLAISILLFALWFLFLLVTALTNGSF